MKSALVTIAKDEDRYIEEWLKYNVKLGFDDIFVYLNDWKYVGEYINSNIHFIDFPGERMQNQCYNGFLESKSKDYDFVAFFDIDEFLVLKKHKTINDYLETQTNSDVIYVNWRLFGDSGLKCVENDNYSVLDRFTKCDKNLYRLGKNIIRTNKIDVRFYNPHIVCLKATTLMLPKYNDTIGNVFETQPWNFQNNIEQDVELFHFRNKTYQECYERKFGKREVFWGNGQWVDINRFNIEFESHNRNDMVNTRARDFFR
jgi:hypothetical protein